VLDLAESASSTGPSLSLWVSAMVMGGADRGGTLIRIINGAFEDSVGAFVSLLSIIANEGILLSGARRVISPADTASESPRLGKLAVEDEESDAGKDVEVEAGVPAPESGIWPTSFPPFFRAICFCFGGEGV